MKSINYLFLMFAFISLGVFTSCSKDEVEVIVDSSMPQGAFTPAKSGNLVEQNGTKSKGAVSLGTDSKGIQFVKLGADFETVLATGTVTVYLSTSQEFKANPAGGNPDIKLIGTISKNGEKFFKLDPKADAKFNHLILWCGSANIPFGYAKLN